MSEEMAGLEKLGSNEKNRSFIIRLTWDNDLQQWHVHFIPTDGSKPFVFQDLESAFLHIAQHYDTT